MLITDIRQQFEEELRDLGWTEEQIAAWDGDIEAVMECLGD